MLSFLDRSPRLTRLPRLLPTMRRRTAEADPTAAGDKGGGWRRTRRVLAWLATAGACALVLFALVGPNQLGRLTPGAFVRIPLEGLVGVALFLVLPMRARRIVAALIGVVLGLLTFVKIIDMGFYAALDRPFDLVLDWILIKDGAEALMRSIGTAGAVAVEMAVGALVIALVVLTALSVLRLSRLAVRHRTTTMRATAVVAVAWVACAVLGAQIVPGAPIASKSAVALAAERVEQVRKGVRDEQAFAALASVDAFRDTAGKDLLGGLRGKDVLLTFVESYGRVAIDDPEFAPRVGAVLDDGNRKLNAAGFASRSAYLTSSTFGGSSWLAHGTLLSGLWIDNQARHRTLLASDRLTLNGAFKRAGWRTVGVMPGVTKSWPEGAFYQYDRVYAAQNLGYQGPLFNFSSTPDQYTLSAFQRSERTSAHAPVMAEMALLSSHVPWSPLPKMVEWEDLGDGSVFDGTRGPADSPTAGRAAVRAAYLESIEYSLRALISYLETYGDDNLVLVFLGDHQPNPTVSGEGASRDVPITIVARDKAVVDRISSWGWQDGLKPDAQAPVWRMDAFRDRFLTAFAR
jgi:hypothetical protein